MLIRISILVNNTKRCKALKKITKMANNLTIKEGQLLRKTLWFAGDPTIYASNGSGACLVPTFLAWKHSPRGYYNYQFSTWVGPKNNRLHESGFKSDDFDEVIDMAAYIHSLPLDKRPANNLSHGIDRDWRSQVPSDSPVYAALGKAKVLPESTSSARPTANEWWVSCIQPNVVDNYEKLLNASTIRELDNGWRIVEFCLIEEWLGSREYPYKKFLPCFTAINNYGDVLSCINNYLAVFVPTADASDWVHESPDEFREKFAGYPAILNTLEQTIEKAVAAA